MDFDINFADCLYRCNLFFLSVSPLLQLDGLSKAITQQNSLLELKRREAAHAKDFIAAQHAHQASLDALALRFETDCLKAEDRLEELKDLETSINKDCKQWNLTENERKEVIDRAVQEGKSQNREMAELHRQLEASSTKAATASQSLAQEKSKEKIANMQIENVRKALSAAQEDAALLRRRLDETELALAERTAALKRETRSAVKTEDDIIKAVKQVKNAKDGLDAEIAAGKKLSMAAADAERRRVDAEKRAKEVQSLLNDARQDQQLAQTELRQQKVASKQAESYAKANLAQAGQSARSLAESLQKHREMEEAIADHETVEKSAKERHSALVTHVKAVKRENDGLDKKIAELSKQEIRLQQQRESLKERCLDRKSELSNTQAQSKACGSKAEKLRKQLQYHEGALNRVNFELLMAKRAAALATTAANSSSPQDQSPAACRLLKQELENELENSKIAQRKQVRTVWDVEAAAQHVGAASEALQQEVTKISEKQKIEDLALKIAESKLQASTIAREDAQLSVDRASMALARSQEEFTDKARTVMQLSTAVEEDELSFKNRASELENKLQELSVDHHEAVNALQKTKSALASRSAAASNASATLSTLQSKTQPVMPAETDRKKEKTATTEGGVASVCNAMQREVKELQAALAAAEADCDVLEHALSAQREATAVVNHLYS